MGAAAIAGFLLVEEEEEEEQQQRRAAQERRGHRRITTRQTNYPRHRVFRNRVSYLGLTEEQCLKRLRLSREAVTEVCHLVQGDIHGESIIRTALPVAVKVTAALNFYATGTFQAPTANITGISQFAVYRSIKEVTDALIRHAPTYLSFRSDEEQQRQQYFFTIAGFPKVQGIIDCMQVAICAPNNNPMAYLNAEGYYSINAQIICDHRQKIMNVNACCPGGMHDFYILKQSEVPMIFEGEGKLNGWLLGDLGYVLQPWLMTPLLLPGTEAENRYNVGHAQTSRVIKQTFGLLKKRFKCLDRSGGALRYAPEKVSKIVTVCCMLHNIAMDSGLSLDSDEELQSIEDEEDHGPQQPPALDQPLQAARQMREEVIAQFFS
ncbi:putative nuclease HARBI1 [Rhincodon typus]|uniref:putative nuclease HARBI1 n=1 Tax=Rhincodon typus TaxID=259920 RepID=UPI00202FFDFB|nr:putative nuclease HARBI1 [Rhincodon typus]